MKTGFLALILAMSAVGCGQQKTKPEPSGSGAGGNPITAPVDYLGAVGRAKNSAERTVDVVSVQRAIQTFHAMEDRYPKDLQELVSRRYLPSLPAPPPGMRLVYDPARGEARMVRQ